MVFTRLHAKFRHRTTRRFGGDRPRQNKHTLKYLVDETTISGFLLCLRLIGAIVPFVFKRVFLHEYLLFYYHCSFSAISPGYRLYNPRTVGLNADELQTERSAKKNPRRLRSR